jgi:hypothetical protein
MQLLSVQMAIFLQVVHSIIIFIFGQSKYVTKNSLHTDRRFYHLGEMLMLNIHITGR